MRRGRDRAADAGVRLSLLRGRGTEFDRLRDLNQSKDQFLASVGHELRTPLTSVLGFAELLRADRGDLSDEERKTMISSVAEEASDLAVPMIGVVMSRSIE